ncbi:DUF1254 domain-containing protein [Leucobacter celer]|uniref:DUF1254 domain-containing protein n=1 Tax=Leucobacter celer TaxID=668625 RepID=UPI0006A7D250|nr:DUF1254 domain-containing protein [Leucobacter celer]
MTESSLTPAEARELAFEAYTYGFAIVENYRAMFGMCVWEGSPQYAGFNRYLHGRELFDSSYDTVVNANNDTLYSTTFADLRAEPLVISVPPTGDRYFVIQLVDMGTDNFAYIGTRETGPDGGDFLLVGPSFKGALPHDRFARVIVAPSQFVALATRTAIDGPEDLDGVTAIQEQLRIRPLSEFLGTRAAAAAPRIDFPAYSPSVYGTAELFPLLNFLLQFHSIPLRENHLLRRLRAIGIGPYETFDVEKFEPDVRAGIEEGVAAAHHAIEERGNALGALIGGWQDIPPMGDYGDDYLFRSAVAWKFIYTNSPQEAIYPIAETDAEGEHLHGGEEYVLHFPAGELPPVDAFWSITLYESASRLMTENAIGRYSIGDRTPGIRYAEDGSLSLYIQHGSPGPDLESNWLPAPAGRFYLNARAYIPRPSFLDGSYRLPAVRRRTAA